ncbi:MAG: peptidoglycan DD-metalloendopeptidase family protein [Ruminococcus sp.]|nr:peptidoglycan DD-metalloendopeptidase family protein [Ruminococcus sp.]
MKQQTKSHKKHLFTFRKFLVTHGIVDVEGDIPVFITFLGSLVVYMVSVIISGFTRAYVKLRTFIRKLSHIRFGKAGVKAAVTAKFKLAVTNIYFRVFVFFDNRKVSRKIFKKRVRDFGLMKALVFTLSDATLFIKTNTQKFKTAFNIALPAVCVAVLVFSVNVVKDSAYGVSVISGGETLGVVSAEDVYMTAAKNFAQKNYYDVENSTGEVFVTARLEITPAADVMDADSLIAAMQTSASVIMPEEGAEQSVTPLSLSMPTISAADLAEETDTAGKIRAYGVTVDGQLIGAVDEPEKLTRFLDAIRAAGNDPEAIDITFDREIDYSYEQFYYPSEITDESDIIETFSGTREAARFITVELGDNPWDLAMENGLTLDELLACPAELDGERIDDISKYCPVGATIQLSEEVPYLNLLVTKPRTYEVAIDYEITQSYDDSMYQGEKKVITKGVEGVELIEANVTYDDGRAVSRQILSRKVVTEPVTQVEVVGTKEPKTMVATGGGSGTYFWPVAGGQISAYMGDGRGHKGLDIRAPYGTHIYAAAQGVVTRAGNKGDGYGNCVFITNSDGNVTVYGHMSSIADIAYGDTVVAGQLIGYVGSTGNSTGNHLHFEVRVNGAYKNPLDYVSQY